MTRNAKRPVVERSSHGFQVSQDVVRASNIYFLPIYITILNRSAEFSNLLAQRDRWRKAKGKKKEKKKKKQKDKTKEGKKNEKRREVRGKDEGRKEEQMKEERRIGERGNDAERVLPTSQHRWREFDSRFAITGSSGDLQSISRSCFCQPSSILFREREIIK